MLDLSLNPANKRILGIDPGRQKTGLALLDAEGQILWRAIVPTRDLRESLAEFFAAHAVSGVALGHSTGSAETMAILKTLLSEKNRAIPVEIIDESHSTLEARGLYFQTYPPRGWRRLVPQSLQNPPVPIDDFAAAVLARRWLKLSERV